MTCECTCDTAGMFYMCNPHKALVDAARAWADNYGPAWVLTNDVTRALIDAARALDGGDQ